MLKNEDLKYYKLSVKNIIFSSFFVFFMPLDPDPDPDSNPDPDPQTWLNPDPIRIRIRIHNTDKNY